MTNDNLLNIDKTSLLTAFLSTLTAFHRIATVWKWKHTTTILSQSHAVLPGFICGWLIVFSGMPDWPASSVLHEVQYLVVEAR